MTRRTLAWPLAWLFGVLVAYASLYPFEGWRVQGANPFDFLTEPLPRYWLAFDVFSNLVGYAPLGFLLAVTALRSGRGGLLRIGAFVVPSVLSLVLETLQVYLPTRVPSNVDWALNTVGGAMGAAMAFAWARLGWLAHWQRARTRWFVADAHGALLLLALWPLALLYPASLPFGLGQVWGTVELSVAQALADTAVAAWWPIPMATSDPLTRAGEAFCVAMGLMAPCVLGYSVLRERWHRLVWCCAVLVGGVWWMGLSSALTYGPLHAWAWLTPPVWAALCMASVGGVLLTGASRRASVVWLALLLLGALTLLNRAPESPYLAESLDIWAQGRFIRFHGLTQWLGWLWPYAALGHAVVQATRRDLG
jgi:VanZ family protein